MSEGLRQPTATHGFEGVNEKRGLSPTTVISCALPSPARSS
jgi:hypothetical protein